ncbi:MAG TPA: nuclear transport factor 2 family protein [Candidatus Binataceae bacterium]
MTNQEKKDLVTRTWMAFGKGDIKGAFANMSDNVSWLVPGTTPGVSGLKLGKDAIVKFMSGVGSLFPQGLNSEIRKTYCEGDAVIIEMTNRGKVSNGKSYENEYCFVFELEDGKIRWIREYADTQKAKEILFS